MTSRSAPSWVPWMPPLRPRRPEGENIGGRAAVARAGGNRALAAATQGQLVRGGLRSRRGDRAHRSRPVAPMERTRRPGRPSGNGPG